MTDDFFSDDNLGEKYFCEYCEEYFTPMKIHQYICTTCIKNKNTIKLKDRKVANNDDLPF
jgi:hypothetical protein|tara:strand:- start:3249 stop:3428 length:180 start_codon:yes stop_codon:yes gene_type:complete